MTNAIVNLGAAESLLIGRTENKELTVGVAKEMGVKCFGVRWVRARFEKKGVELGAKIDLSALT